MPFLKKISFFFLLIVLLIQTVTQAQTPERSLPAYHSRFAPSLCARTPRLARFSPDSANGFLASHHKVYTSLVAQLGYIDTAFVAHKTLIDNLDFGLQVWPSPNNYEIVSYKILCSSPKQDAESMSLTGNQLSVNAWYLIHRHIGRKGGWVEFYDIRMVKKGSSITMPLPPFKLKYIDRPFD